MADLIGFEDKIVHLLMKYPGIVLKIVFFLGRFPLFVFVYQR